MYAFFCYIQKAGDTDTCDGLRLRLQETGLQVAAGLIT